MAWLTLLLVVNKKYHFITPGQSSTSLQRRSTIALQTCSLHNVRMTPSSLIRHAILLACALSANAAAQSFAPDYFEQSGVSANIRTRAEAMPHPAGYA
jgi:hypothetical protein